MAKTLKQILDGVKSSKTKTKDILGTKPGVDYSPKAGDERKFADKHHVEKHADRAGNGDDVYNATNVKSYMDTDKSAHHGYKNEADAEKVYEAAKCNMSEEGKLCEVHGMKQCPGKVLKEKPVKEEIEQVDELMVQNYVSGAKGKSAEVHKNMNAGNYTVKKMSAGKEVGSSEHDDSSAAHAAAKKHIGEESELEEKAAVAKSKQTMLVTKKGSKTAGGVIRIKKSDYDPKKHDLAEDEEINEISKGKAIKTYAHAGSAGDYGMTDKTFDQGERLLGHIKRKFGDKAGEHAEKAAHAAYWGRGTPAPGKDKLTSNVKMRVTAAGKANKQDVVSKKKEIKARLGVKEETDIEERKMSDTEMKKRERIVKGMKKKLSDFRSRYGKRAKDVMYATATKQAMGEDYKVGDKVRLTVPLSNPNYEIAGSDDKHYHIKMRDGRIQKFSKDQIHNVNHPDRTSSGIKEDLAQPLIGSTDPTKDKKKKKETEQAPAVTPITLPDYSADVNTGRNV